MNINPPHIVSVTRHARLFVDFAYPEEKYFVCGELTLTPFWAIARGHDHESNIITGVAVPRELVKVVQDMEADECTLCDEIAREAAEAANAEETEDSQ